MRIRGIVSGIIATINPTTTGDLWLSNGYTTTPAGKRVPAYTLSPGVPLDVQALSGPDLAQIDGLNIAGVKRAVYLFGAASTQVRANADGGSVLFFDGKNWLVIAVLETWSDWCKVAVAQQIDGAFDIPGQTGGGGI